MGVGGSGSVWLGVGVCALGLSLWGSRRGDEVDGLVGGGEGGGGENGRDGGAVGGDGQGHGESLGFRSLGKGVSRVA